MKRPRWLCQHEFIYTSQKFIPAPVGKVKTEGISEKLMQRLLFGYTAKSVVCKKCGKSEWRHYIGDWTR